MKRTTSGDVTIAGVTIPLEAARNLELVGDPAEIVASDLADMRAGALDRDGLLAKCLDGADEECASDWHDYVDALAAHVAIRTSKQAPSSTDALRLEAERLREESRSKLKRGDDLGAREALQEARGIIQRARTEIAIREAVLLVEEAALDALEDRHADSAAKLDIARQIVSGFDSEALRRYQKLVGDRT